jgi:DNA-binding response OmpR family regulator
VAPPTGAALRVLLVEDDPDHVELVKRGLEGQARPVEVEVVGDGEAALRRLEAGARAELPDLLLLDLRLPGMEGLRLLQEVRARSWLAGLRCVVLTTSDAERDRVRARELRADDYLVKPGDLRSFARLVREATEPPGPAR